MNRLLSANDTQIVQQLKQESRS